MQGFDPAEAVKAIVQQIDARRHPVFAEEMESLIRQAVDLDMQYMRESGVIASDGMAGNAYYDDDEAFEFILDVMARSRGYDDERELVLGALIEEYLDAQQAYMESAGLLEWD